MSMTIQQAIENRERCYKYLLGCVPNATPENVEAVRLSLEALREKAEREDPKPLTLKELRQMDGEPVWLEPNTKWDHLQGGWFLVDVDHNKLWHPFDIAGPLDKEPENYKLYRHKPKDVSE